MTYNVFSGTLNPTHFTSLHVIANILHGTAQGVVCQGTQWLRSAPRHPSHDQSNLRIGYNTVWSVLCEQSVFQCFNLLIS